MNPFILVAATAVLVSLYRNYFEPQPTVWAAPSQLELTYFAEPGRAELSRLILSARDVVFEDVRLDQDAFLAIKPTGYLRLGSYTLIKIKQRVSISPG
ncbi:hypothetical protein GN958_ATG12882 [Phytophthora infestans]|uniref:Secreted RxLR effector peptide protein n=1 Tax=Phytophthora infestans TaxID=4787 RepID=A0A8S9UF93_PHYIN|nr:hypothetical protein GN958_ATG12882 [Phytophthora infestans]